MPFDFHFMSSYHFVHVVGCKHTAKQVHFCGDNSTIERVYAVERTASLFPAELKRVVMVDTINIHIGAQLIVHKCNEVRCTVIAMNYSFAHNV